MHTQNAANSGPGFHMNMSRESHGIGNDDVIFQDTIVTDVGITHDQIVITNSGNFVAPCGTVNRDVFTNLITVANPNWTQRSVVFQILRL